jgi:hypothetical protein
MDAFFMPFLDFVQELLAPDCKPLLHKTFHASLLDRHDSRTHFALLRYCAPHADLLSHCTISYCQPLRAGVNGMRHRKHVRLVAPSASKGV